ncbi:hypothetical protein LWE61_16425 [Sphingobium sufflavum]|uniref:hypothetical protein n=1 Tax=Sphingobium sufflavum TaxID=1129547 RepID=UPI001F315411|nr:hypothetical protein [Sphingobium sufflavum]MCE7798129.1 hypothetical protein [Sphingobium sufflavum]
MVEITGMSIQSQDIGQPFSAFMAMPGIRSRKLAFVCGTGLSRLPASRLTDRDSVDFFTNIADA